MRNSQLDSSSPRGRRSPIVESAATPVTVQYLPPILVAIGAALILVLVFAVLAFMTFTITMDAASSSPDSGGGLSFGSLSCGLVTLLLAGGALFFVNATRIAASDLGGRPVTLEGTVQTRQRGRGRSGGFWVVVRPLGSAPEATRQPVGEPEPSAPTFAGGPVEAPTRERGFVSSSGGSFGEQLQGATIAPRAAQPAASVDPLSALKPQRLAPGDVNFRLDKHIYEALAPGDRVDVVYSRNLQHVYYVRKRAATGESVVLRNLSLL
ncbi:MAG TPA: hypothetical protein VM536_03495 [Chloroflexia bacterium]|nr:hypothetical protein [Chloroflexia bacterium]